MKDNDFRLIMDDDDIPGWEDFHIEDDPIDAGLENLYSELSKLIDDPLQEEGLSEIGSPFKRIMGGIALADVFIQEGKCQKRDLLPVLIEKARLLQRTFPCARVPDFGNAGKKDASAILKDACTGKDITSFDRALLSKTLEAFAEAIYENKQANGTVRDPEFEQEFRELVKPVYMFPTIEEALEQLSIDEKTLTATRGAIVANRLRKFEGSSLAPSIIDAMSEYEIYRNYVGSDACQEFKIIERDVCSIAQFLFALKRKDCDILLAVYVAKREGLPYRRGLVYRRNWLVHLDDLKDPTGLIASLRNGSDDLSGYILKKIKLKKIQKKKVDAYDETDEPSEATIRSLINKLNDMIRSESFFGKKKTWSTLPSELKSKAEELAKLKGEGQDAECLHRRLLEEAYPEYIVSIRNPRPVIQRLSDRECQVIMQLIENVQNPLPLQELAGELVIPSVTLKNQLSDLRAKCGSEFLPPLLNFTSERCKLNLCKKWCLIKWNKIKRETSVLA